MTKLADELRAERKQQIEAARRAEAKAREAQRKKDAENGKLLFFEIVEDLPSKLRESAKRGEDSYCVLKSTYKDGCQFNGAERQASYELEAWAKDQGFWTSRTEYRRYEGGEDSEALWIHWSDPRRNR